MLVMRRRKGEAILIGGDVEVRIISIGRSRVKLGINAPKSVSVVACEFQLVEQENRAAARAIPGGLNSAAIARLLQQTSAKPVNPPQRTEEPIEE